MELDIIHELTIQERVIREEISQCVQIDVHLGAMSQLSLGQFVVSDLVQLILQFASAKQIRKNDVRIMKELGQKLASMLVQDVNKIRQIVGVELVTKTLSIIDEVTNKIRKTLILKQSNVIAIPS
jgi:hypothetical protein